MKITENEPLAEELLDYLRDILAGRGTLPAIDYKRDLTYYHRSELLGCLMIPFLARTVDPSDVQPLSKDRVLYFARGRAVERFFGADNVPLVKDGIVVSVDRISPFHGLVEMKSTIMSSDNFEYKLRTTMKHWIEECKVVAAAYDDTAANLAIMFLAGNKKRWGMEGRVGVDLKAWRMEFDKDELREAWYALFERRNYLDAALNTGIAPSLDVVKQTVTSWGCKDCTYNNLCPYFQCLTWGPSVVEKKEEPNEQA
jgi:hypothetical protein